MPLGDPDRFGLWAFLGTVAMLFIGFTSAYILRRASADWQPLTAPRFSGSTPRRFSRAAPPWRSRAGASGAGTCRAARGSSLLTGAPGPGLRGGPVPGLAAALAAQGVFLASNPHSSFFYVLTGAARPAPPRRPLLVRGGPVRGCAAWPTCPARTAFGSSRPTGTSWVAFGSTCSGFCSSSWIDDIEEDDDARRLTPPRWKPTGAAAPRPSAPAGRRR